MKKRGPIRFNRQPSKVRGSIPRIWAACSWVSIEALVSVTPFDIFNRLLLLMQPRFRGPLRDREAWCAYGGPKVVGLKFNTAVVKVSGATVASEAQPDEATD
jgi:hypothetical protein